MSPLSLSISLNGPPQPQARAEPSMGWPFPGTRQIDQAVHALACTLVTLGFVTMTPTKRNVGVLRQPTAFLLPIVARTEIRRFRLQGQLTKKLDDVAPVCKITKA